MAVAAVTEPPEEAVLVDELDAAAAGARVLERVLGVALIPADATHISLLLLVADVLPIGRRIIFRRRSGGVPDGVEGRGDLHEVTVGDFLRFPVDFFPSRSFISCGGWREGGNGK